MRGGDRVGRVGARRRRCCVDVRTQPDTLRATRLDVGLERRVVLLVVGGVVADDVDDRRAARAGVVQVGEPVAEPGPEVQQRGRRACRPCAP